MSNDSKISFVLHWLKGVKMEAQTSPFLRFSIGVTVILCGVSVLISTIAPNGFF